MGISRFTWAIGVPVSGGLFSGSCHGCAQSMEEALKALTEEAPGYIYHKKCIASINGINITAKVKRALEKSIVASCRQ